MCFQKESHTDLEQLVNDDRIVIFGQTICDFTIPVKLINAPSFQNVNIVEYLICDIVMKRLLAQIFFNVSGGHYESVSVRIKSCFIYKTYKKQREIACVLSRTKNTRHCLFR